MILYNSENSIAVLRSPHCMGTSCISDFQQPMLAWVVLIVVHIGRAQYELLNAF